MQYFQPHVKRYLSESQTDQC